MRVVVVEDLGAGAPGVLRRVERGRGELEGRSGVVVEASDQPLFATKGDPGLFQPDLDTALATVTYGDGDAVLPKAKSVTGVMLVITGGFVLLPGTGSPVGEPTMAIFVKLPFAGAVTVKVTFVT